MTEQDLRADSGLAEEFATEALRLRLQFQRKYAGAVLERQCAIAMGEHEGDAVQLRAIADFQEQTLGRPMAPFAIPAKPEEHTVAALEAVGARLREKLDRMASRNQSACTADADE